MTTGSKHTKTRAFALGIAGALALPIFAVSASASLDNGGFQIRAQATGDSTISAIRGGNLATDPGGGGTTNPPVEAFVYEYQCGPMNLKITQNMIDLSQANSSAIASGGTVTPHPDGWTEIKDIQSQTPITSTKPSLGVSAYKADGFSESILALNLGAENCRVSDFRNLDKAPIGEVRSSQIVRASSLTAEARIVSIGGTRYLETQTKVGAGDPSISRVTADDRAGSIDSSTIPSDIASYPSATANAGIKKAFTFTESGDLGKSWVIEEMFDGTTIERHSANGSGVTVLPNGAPGYAKWNSAGTFIAYASNDGTFVNSTLAQWNAARGTNWDGKQTDRSTLQGLTPSFTHIPF